MKFLYFLEEKITFILFQISFIVIIFLSLLILNIHSFFIILITSTLLIYTIIYLEITYYKEKKKRDNIISLVDGLDEKYLISEILQKPKTLENSAYYYALKQACKSMNDKISILEKEDLEYKEYIESFAHEIKTPIAALSLAFDNNKNYKLKEELEQISIKVEQMLYYARSDNTEKDYFIKELNLSEIIHHIILNYKDYLLRRKITLNIHDLDHLIYTDEKWLTFIASQIIQNSIKYLDKTKKSIEIYSKENKNNIILSILDNGCGIKEQDIKRIFEKGFTGTDRKKTNSTGMGLYLSKKLSDKLGLKLQVESIDKKYTKVDIIFPKNNIYKMQIPHKY